MREFNFNIYNWIATLNVMIRHLNVSSIVLEVYLFKVAKTFPLDLVGNPLVLGLSLYPGVCCKH